MSTIQIASLDKQHKDNIIEVFSTAFEKYPLMEFFLGNTPKDLSRGIWQYIGDIALIRDSSLLGAFVDGKLQGVAFINSPDKPTDDVEKLMAPLEEQLAIAIGEEAAMRMDAYSRLKDANKPSQPHFYINLIGVHPQSQGKGVGKALLSQIRAMSEQHPQSCGVGLDTQTEQNAAYYQRCGYGVSNTTKLDFVPFWFMFQPT